jgi:hypothetical protein
MTDQPISPLVADLMTASLRQTQQVTSQVIDNLTERAEVAEATLNAVVESITDLLTGPWMPTPDALLSALYPSSELVAVYRKRVDQ